MAQDRAGKLLNHKEMLALPAVLRSVSARLEAFEILRIAWQNIAIHYEVLLAIAGKVKAVFARPDARS